MNSWLIRKDPDAGKDWRQEKVTTEDEIVGWHHWLDGHEFKQAPGAGDGQGSLACCSPWGCKESDMTEWLNWTENISNAHTETLCYIDKWLCLRPLPWVSQLCPEEQSQTEQWIVIPRKNPSEKVHVLEDNMIGLSNLLRKHRVLSLWPSLSCSSHLCPTCPGPLFGWQLICLNSPCVFFFHFLLWKIHTYTKLNRII